MWRMDNMRVIVDGGYRVRITEEVEIDHTTLTGLNIAGRYTYGVDWSTEALASMAEAIHTVGNNGVNGNGDYYFDNVDRIRGGYSDLVILDPTPMQYTPVPINSTPLLEAMHRYNTLDAFETARYLYVHNNVVGRE
jgi:hypothetical protein